MNISRPSASNEPFCDAQAWATGAKDSGITMPFSHAHCSPLDMPLAA
ncbi:hypothetical protein ACFWXO_32620 [Kitasatospora sp. NPDC059088]